MSAAMSVLVGALLALSFAGSPGCDDPGSGSDADSDTDADTDTDTDTDADTDTDTGTDADTDTDPMLDGTHPGWDNPECRSCHPDAHNPDMNIGGCVDCHGKNGASAGHTDCGGSNAGAVGCHAGVHGGAATGFPAGTCGPCHN